MKMFLRLFARLGCAHTLFVAGDVGDYYEFYWWCGDRKLLLDIVRCPRLAVVAMAMVPPVFVLSADHLHHDFVFAKHGSY